MSSGWIYYWISNYLLLILNIKKMRLEITRNETERGKSWPERKLVPVLCGRWSGMFWFHVTVNNLDVRTDHLTKVGRHSQHTVGLLLRKKNWLIWLLGEKCISNRMNSSWKEKHTMPLFPMTKKCGNLGTLDSKENWGGRELGCSVQQWSQGATVDILCEIASLSEEMIPVEVLMPL